MQSVLAASGLSGNACLLAFFSISEDLIQATKKRNWGGGGRCTDVSGIIKL